MKQYFWNSIIDHIGCEGNSPVQILLEVKIDFQNKSQCIISERLSLLSTVRFSGLHVDSDDNDDLQKILREDCHLVTEEGTATLPVKQSIYFITAILEERPANKQQNRKRRNKA